MSQGKFPKCVLLTVMATSLTSCSAQVLEDTRPVPSEFSANNEPSQTSNFKQELDQPTQDHLTGGKDTQSLVNKTMPSPPDETIPPLTVPPDPDETTRTVPPDPDETTRAVPPDPDETTRAAPPWGPAEFWEVTERSCLVGCHIHNSAFRSYDYIVASKDAFIDAIEKRRMPDFPIGETFWGTADETLLLNYLRNL